MEIRLGSAAGPKLGAVPECINYFAKETQLRQMQWAQRLAEDADRFAEVEVEIDHYYRLGAGRLTAALLAEVTAQPAMTEQVEQIRTEATQPMRKPKSRHLRARLLCRLMLFITTGCCAPQGKAKKKGSQERRAGMYPELAALTFGKGCSPALQYAVARIVALNPSIALARKELARQGI